MAITWAFRLGCVIGLPNRREFVLEISESDEDSVNANDSGCETSRGMLRRSLTLWPLLERWLG